MFKSLAVDFSSRKATSKKNDATRQQIPKRVQIVQAFQWFGRLTMAGSILRSS
jgi:hypothetical protein